jgi:IMP dehydrogenase
VAEIELGLAKRAREAFDFDQIALVPSRRTRDPENVTTSWKVDAFEFTHPIIAAPADSVVSPTSAAELSALGGLAVLNLEGLWTRYADPAVAFAKIAAADSNSISEVLQKVYAQPIDPDLIVSRIKELRAAGIVTAASLSPKLTHKYWQQVVAAGVDLFVIRGATVSAEHVSNDDNPLNLKKFIYELEVPVIVGGCATYQAALHLMRAGAAGVLVGFGGGSSGTTTSVLGVKVPMATAVADVAAARRDYLDESGGRYVQVIADGGVHQTGDIAKAIACGADAVMVGSMLARADQAPGQGFHWAVEAGHPTLPRASAIKTEPIGSFEKILHGPATNAAGLLNAVGALRRSMATCGYSDIKELQRVEVIISQ